MRTWLVAALVVLLSGAAGAEEKDARVAWLEDNALRVRSIDPADEDFEDLEPLKKILGDARIVQLGEQTHGDGACFLAKARLIKFLHREMGFDVLAFESGLYDCAKGWQNLRDDPRGVSPFDLGVFGIWTLSHQVKPTIDYLRATATSKRPLTLCGYDCQLTSRVARRSLLDDLRATAKEAAPACVQGEEAMAIARVVQRMLSDAPKLTKREADAGSAWLARLRAGLESGAGALRARERAFWIQATKSLAAQIGVIRARGAGTRTAVEDNNPRDAAMADNLIWLADAYFPKRKIIVWAATFHLMRNPAQLEPLRRSLSYEKLVPMGHLVARHFGTACYTLGFTAFGGEAGRPFGGTRPWSLPRPSAGSFDALCAAAGLDNALVDLRSPPEGGAWLRRPFVTRPLGNSEMRGPWHEVLDGLFFQRTMTPSTRGPYRSPAKTSGGLLDELRKTWSNIQRGLASGNAWANKWTFEPVLERWRSATGADAKAIRAQEPAIRGFLDEHRDAPEAVWRAHALLAAMARVRGEPKAARKALEAALEAFPDKEIPDVSRTGQFQHLVNAYAFLEWERTQRPPIPWAMGVLAKDRRLRVFYWRAWTERDAAVAPALKKALVKAYAKRKKRFPEQAAEIDRALAGL